MAKYIELEAVKTRIDKEMKLCNAGIARGILDFVKKTLHCSADVIDVVKCGKCVYWQDNNGGYPHEECRWGKGETPDAEDFCSYGERKGGDHG